MNAQQAREAAKKNSLTKNLPAILDYIKKATNDGKFECWCYEVVTAEERKRLTELGYKVGKQDFDRNEPLILIKW